MAIVKGFSQSQVINIKHLSKMAREKKKIPEVKAPVVEKKEDTVPATTETKVEIPGIPSGLDQNHKADMIGYAQHRKDEMLKNNENNPEKYKALTLLEDALFLDTTLTEVVIRKNPVGSILTINKANYEGVFVPLAKDMGVSVPSYESLPKPTKEQLAQAGLTAAPNQVMLQIEDKNISKEAKEKKKAEHAAIENAKNKDYTKDHTKIETDDQLKEALEFQLLNPTITNPIERLITTAQFYRSYKEFRASNAENSEAELAKVHELDLAALLQDIITMVKPTFVLTGFGKRLCTLAEDANSVIPAFCGFKNCLYNKKTKQYKYDDATIASLVRVLIVWYVSAKNAEMSEAIKAKEENIKVLKKDEKANAKGIETETKKIAGLKSAITHFTGMISLVTDPSFDVVDNFIAIYNDKSNANYISACAIKKEIFNTYYNDVEIPELEFESALLNVQQRAGIILNMFSSPLAKSDDYSESNLIDFGTVEKKDGEGEGESKNS